MEAKPRCVIVDDDVEFLDQVKRFFVAACLDYEVVAFPSSTAAVDYLRTRRADVILTAYLVPQIDGLQFIRLVRAMDARVPILMLSSVPVKAAALAVGATAFIAKRSLWTHLAAALRNACQPPAQSAA